MKYTKTFGVIAVVAMFSTFAGAQAEVADGIGKSFSHSSAGASGAHPGGMPGNMGDMMVPQAPEGPVLTGKVIEVINGGGYSYLNLEADGKQFWIAGTQVNAKVGDKIGYIENVIMENFSSRTLNRTFDRIIFASSVSVQP